MLLLLQILWNFALHLAWNCEKTKHKSTMADSQDAVRDGVAGVLTEDQQSVANDSVTDTDVEYKEQEDNV